MKVFLSLAAAFFLLTIIGCGWARPPDPLDHPYMACWPVSGKSPMLFCAPVKEVPR